MIIPKCAANAFGLEEYYWKQFHAANKMIDELTAKITEANAAPLQYSLDSQQSRVSEMSRGLGEYLKAREYWVGQRMDAIENLTRLGVGVDECCGETGLTVMIPAY